MVKTGHRLAVICDCGKEVESIVVDQYSSVDFIEFMKKPDNQLCNTCYIKELKRRDKESASLDKYFKGSRKKI
jgi:hypothetical protein